MSSEITIKGVLLVVKRGDITEEKVDAVVSPANTKGVMAGGVAAALKEKGGEQIEKDAIASAPGFRWNAFATTAGKLAARKVIHAPTVQDPGFKSDSRNIDRATRAALGVAKDIGAKVVSIPGMGCGSGGVPAAEAAQVMVSATRYFLAENEARHPIKEIRFVAFDEGLEQALDAALATLSPKPAEAAQEEEEQEEEGEPAEGAGEETAEGEAGQEAAPEGEEKAPGEAPEAVE